MADATDAPSATSEYVTPVVTNFHSVPLTTAYAAPSECSGIYSADVLVVDFMRRCLPPKHRTEETAFFSPGYVCPSGYMTARVENQGVASITTVTCCPYRGDMILSAVDPATLSGDWAGMFCTWEARSPTVLDITISTRGETSATRATIESPGGINAYGVRMVYQQSDIDESISKASASATHTGGSSSPTGSSGDGSSSTSPARNGGRTGSDLSVGGAVAIAAVVPVFSLLVIAGAITWYFRYKKRRRKQSYSRVDDSTSCHDLFSRFYASTYSSASSLKQRSATAGPPHAPSSGHSLYGHDTVHQYPPSVAQAGYDSYQQQPLEQYQHHRTAVHRSSMASLQASASSTPQPQSSTSAQYGDGGAFESFVALNTHGDDEPSAEEAAGLKGSNELAAAVPMELPHRHGPSSGQHIDSQKMIGVGPPPR